MNKRKLIILGIILVLVAILVVRNTEQSSTDDPALVPAQQNVDWWEERHTDRRLNVINNQKIVLVGDSITHGWEGTEAWDILNAKYDNKITNLGFGGDGTQHVIWRLTNGEFPSGINPEYTVLMIGTNNTSWGYQPKSIAAGIEKIIEIIHERAPDTKIILFSIFPREAAPGNSMRVNNNKVDEIIKQYDGSKNVRYYDIGQYYTDEKGAIIYDLYAPDLLHLAPAGYTVWKDKLVELIGE
jgi:lysophospholipase L1-like esterase